MEDYNLFKIPLPVTGPGFETLDYLPPGLYEMRIDEEETSLPGEIQNYNVRFEERRMADIMAFDDGREDEKAFYAVAAVSDIIDRFYRTFVGPWIRMGVNAQTAEMNQWLHPLRMSRYAFSDINPLECPPPIALFWGENDPILPVKHGRAMLSRSNGITLTTCKKCRHFPHLDAGPAFAHDLKQFLLDPRRPSASFFKSENRKIW
jgi:pimeloyl-ACP methyl ester carboxylesterase